MSWSERAARGGAVILALALAATPAAGQRRPSVIGAQLHLLATAADDPVFGIGLGLEFRTSRRVAVSGTVTGGRQAGSTGARWEGLVLYRLDLGPGSRVTWYGGGGVALQRFAASSEYLVVVLGVERAAGGWAGWFGEVGLGGGFRGAVGVRLRRSRQP